jgi:hypothetical protein
MSGKPLVRRHRLAMPTTDGHAGFASMAVLQRGTASGA